MKKFIFVFFILWQAQAFAEEVCVTVDITGWPQEKINLMQATAYELATREGDNNFPARNENRLCFENPTFNVAAAITRATVSERYDLDEAARESARREELQIKEEAKHELSGNVLAQAALDEIDHMIDPIERWEDLKAFVKTLARYMLAKERSGE